MRIQDLSQTTGVAAKTIRYYEDIGLLPQPARAENNYRKYSEQDVEHLRLVAGARRLDLSLDDIREILALRDRREAPCRVLLERLEQKADEIAERIRALQQLESELRGLQALGLTFPTDDVDGKHCVCHLVSERAKGQEPSMAKLFQGFNPLKTGIIGSIVAALGLGWLTGYLDYVLVPVLFVFLGLTSYGLYCQTRERTKE